MTENRAFWRAIHSLAHPITILAIVVLLVNDHWLRWQYPSWLTGKLGDFTWLIFAPFIAALFLSLVIPRRIGRHEQRVGLMAFLIIGSWFALAKTVPVVNFATVQAWNGLVGWQGINRLDATDLLTLPALLIGAYIWQKAANSAINLRPLGYVAFAFGIVATLASDGMSYSYTDQGVTHICEHDGKLVTVTPGFLASETYVKNKWEYTVYSYIHTSTNGGLNWQTERVEDKQPVKIECEVEKHLIKNPQNPNIQYRWQAGEYIEKSSDGGKTWQVEYNLFELNHEVRVFFNHPHPDEGSGWERTVKYVPSPVSGIFHSESGNVVLAMSQDGVLVRTHDGRWQWVQVGEYGFVDLYQSKNIERVLFLHFLLVITLFFLILTSTTATIRNINKIRSIWLLFGWLGWLLLIAFAFPRNSHNMILFSAIGLFSLFFIALPLSLGAIWDMARNFRGAFLPVVITAIPAIAAFMFPFILWAVGTIPRYFTAAVFSILVTGSVLVAAYIFWKPRLPTPEKEKRKNEDLNLPVT